MKRKAAVAGHVCLDITPVFGDKYPDSVSDILIPGSLTHVGPADIHTGGCVSNTGLALKKLGIDVLLVGKIGNDPFGNIISETFSSAGADDGLIRSDSSSTSYSVVLAIPGIDRIFLHDPGANDEFRASDIPWDSVRQADLFHFGYPPLMRSLYSDGGSELLNIIQTAKKYGCVTSLDMAAVDPSSEAGKADWRSILGRVLPYVDIFVPSVEELCFMLDRNKLSDIYAKASGKDVTDFFDPEMDILPLARECLLMGAKIVLIKAGAPGMFLCTAGTSVMESIPGIKAPEWADACVFEKSYMPDKVVSGTGAGDTSIAAFLASILNGESPEWALHLASAEGASCVEDIDALSGIKTLDELKARITAGWKKR